MYEHLISIVQQVWGQVDGNYRARHKFRGRDPGESTARFRAEIPY